MIVSVNRETTPRCEYLLGLFYSPALWFSVLFFNDIFWYIACTDLTFTSHWACLCSSVLTPEHHRGLPTEEWRERAREGAPAISTQTILHTAAELFCSWLLSYNVWLWNNEWKGLITVAVRAQHTAASENPRSLTKQRQIKKTSAIT